MAQAYHAAAIKSSARGQAKDRTLPHRQSGCASQQIPMADVGDRLRWSRNVRFSPERWDHAIIDRPVTMDVSRFALRQKIRSKFRYGSIRKL